MCCSPERLLSRQFATSVLHLVIGRIGPRRSVGQGVKRGSIIEVEKLLCKVGHVIAVFKEKAGGDGLIGKSENIHVFQND